MSGLTGRIVSGLVFAVLVFVGLAVFADLQDLLDTLHLFEVTALVPALFLAFGNYVIRFLRWDAYLKVIGVSRRVSKSESFAIFFAGMVMSITPGKVGELLKSVLLRQRRDIPVSETAPVVVTERLTDFVAVLLLCFIGAFSADYGIEVVLVGGILSVIALVVCSSERLANQVFRLLERLPFVQKVVPALRQSYQNMNLLVRPRPLVQGLLYAVIAWWLECVALFVILSGFPELSPTLGHCVFIYAFATLAGAVTMLPGGLVFTEGSMIVLLTAIVPFMVTEDVTVATAATVVVRFCTLWFAVALGLCAMGWLRSTQDKKSS